MQSDVEPRQLPLGWERRWAGGLPLTFPFHRLGSETFLDDDLFIRP